MLSLDDRITILEREQYIYHPYFKKELKNLEWRIVQMYDLLNLPIWEIIRLKIKLWITKI